MQLPNPISWTPSGGIRLLDQTRLPGEERYLELETVDAVAEAISSLRVRGAPLIGIAAAMGVALAVRRSLVGTNDLLDHARRAMATLAPPVPPRSIFAGPYPDGAPGRRAVKNGEPRRSPARRGAGDLGRGPRDVRADRRSSVPRWSRDSTVAPSCNAGSLATGGIGSALAPVYHPHRLGGAPGAHHARDPAAAPGWPADRLGADRAGVQCTLVADGATRAAFAGATSPAPW